RVANISPILCLALVRQLAGAPQRVNYLRLSRPQQIALPMNGEYAHKPPAYAWDVGVGLDALRQNIIDFILFCGFIASILGSFYFFYWLKTREMRNVCSKNY
ncbi:hypothetical protein PVNG_03939, partial [Plasmodium vivax North Korean]